MPLPADILLPANSRYFKFTEHAKTFNEEYDIVWSFKYKVPERSVSSPLYQFGFATYLATLASDGVSLPGQFIGDLDPASEGTWPMTTEGGDYISTEDGSIINTTELAQLIKIAVDSTGFYALSSDTGRTGVGINNVQRDSIVIRDNNNDVIYNTPLTAFSPTIPLTSNDYTTLRFRYANRGTRLYIDHKLDNDAHYTTLTSISITPNDIAPDENVYVGFSFSTPISSAGQTLSAKEFYLKNFHIEGVEGATTSESVSSAALSSITNTARTTVSNITAR